MREIEEIIARALRQSCIDHLQVEPGVTIAPGMVADVLAAIDAAGLVIVPKEPTAEMKSSGDFVGDYPWDGMKAVRIYRAMLEARPK